MSVYTPVSPLEAQQFLQDYALGDIEGLKGIESGVENSNFFLTTTTGEYVLTVFEKQTEEDLRFYLALMAHLGKAEAGFAVPLPQTRFHDRDTPSYLGRLHGKPAAIVSRLPGTSIDHPTPEDCHAVGVLLASMHEVGVDFDQSMPNWRGAEWRELFAEHMFTCIMRDDVALASLDIIGEANVMWEADYPHESGTFPNSRALLAESLARTPDAQARRIAEGNARALFGI
jgi:homoserine kinase type II